MKSHELAKKLLELPDAEIDIRGMQYDDDNVQIVRVSGDGPVVVIELELVESADTDHDCLLSNCSFFGCPLLKDVADTHYQCTGCNTTPCDCHDELITNTGSLR